jgi:uncharacterized protein
MLTSILVLVGIALGLFVALCVLLYLKQDRILFYPGPNDAALRAEWQARQIEIPSGDQVLEGWWADNPGSSNARTIIYFGGNAEDVLYTASTASRLHARRLLVVNYRGYGGTPGEPSQEALYEDALAIHDYVVGTSHTRPEDIVVMGRSLGSGLATLLAAKRKVGGAILIAPFDSIAAVAATHYPVFPVELLLKHPFDSASLARQAAVPAIMIAADHDNVIPPKHARRLYDAWSGPKAFHLLDGVGHNDIELHPEYYTLINGFLSDLE